MQPETESWVQNYFFPDSNTPVFIVAYFRIANMSISGLVGEGSVIFMLDGALKIPSVTAAGADLESIMPSEISQTYSDSTLSTPMGI